MTVKLLRHDRNFKPERTWSHEAGAYVDLIGIWLEWLSSQRGHDQNLMGLNHQVISLVNLVLRQEYASKACMANNSYLQC